MEEKGKRASQFKSGSSSDSRAGLVCRYQLKGSTSQFIFLRADRETGALYVDYSLSFSTESRLEILCSCNGLLLLSHFEKKQLKYLVFDPVSNICVALPHPCTNVKILLSGLASSGNHFNVVLVQLTGIPHGESTGSVELQIFSSSSGKWRRHCPTNLPLPLSPAFVKSPNKLLARLTSKVFRSQLKTWHPETVTASLYSNGAIYWTISGHLLVYHVKVDHCELIELPYAHEGASHQHHCLWESGGRLKLSYTDESGVHTWHLLDDEDYDAYFGFKIYDRNKFRWRLEDTISDQQLTRREAERPRAFNQWRAHDVSPVTCHEAPQLMYLRVPGGIISYNTDNHVTEPVCNFWLPGTKKTRGSCCSFLPFSYAGLNIIECETRAVEAAAINLPVENLANHVYF